MRSSSREHGFTLIELMVVVALLVILAALAAPSFRNMIEMQRLRGVNAQIVTDLQFVRGEAVRRGVLGRVVFGSKAGEYTCYTLFVTRDPTVNLRCNCAPASDATPVCPVGGLVEEIKTVRIRADSGVSVSVAVPPSDDPVGNAFAFDNVTGGLSSIRTDLAPAPLAAADIEARLDNDRRLLTKLVQTGRPQVCAPNAAVMQVNACVP